MESNTNSHPPLMRKFSPRMDRIGTEDAFSVMIKANEFERKELTPHGKKLIRLQIGEPAFNTPKHINKAAIKAIKDNQTHYTAPPGIRELRTALAKQSSLKTGLDFDTEDIVVHSGAKPSAFYTINAVIDPGDETIVFDPAWPIYASVTNYMGGTTKFIPLKEELGFQPDIEEVKAAITDRTVLMVVNTPCNPTGGVFSEETLEALAKIAVENDLWVLSDEIYDHIIFEGEHKSLLKYPGMAERSILLNGASKTYAMTGYRMGWSATKNKRMQYVIERLQTNDTSCPAAPNQFAFLEAITSPKTPAAVEKMRLEYLKRRDLIHELVNDVPGLSANLPKGTFYLFANAKPLCEKLNCNSAELADKIMREAHVLLLHGTSFGPHGEGFIRFSYVSSEEDIREGVKRIKEWATAQIG